MDKTIIGKLVKCLLTQWIYYQLNVTLGFSLVNWNLYLAKITILPSIPLYTISSSCTGWTNWPIFDVHLNWRQFFPCHDIHLYSISIINTQAWSDCLSFSRVNLEYSRNILLINGSYKNPLIDRTLYKTVLGYPPYSYYWCHALDTVIVGTFFNVISMTRCGPDSRPTPFKQQAKTARNKNKLFVKY